mgnify:FL=1
MLEGSCHCGAVKWTYAGEPDGATTCNCTLCRRYGVLWIYGHEGEGGTFSGPTRIYTRGAALEFHFCPTCGCVVAWRALHPQADGRKRCAVNVRLAEPDAVANIPIDHFDGLHSFADTGRDGRAVKDYWF